MIDAPSPTVDSVWAIPLTRFAQVEVHTILTSGTGLKPKPLAFMRTYGQALPPFWFINFCSRFGNECKSREVVTFERSDLTPQRKKDLLEVNAEVNKSIKPKTDLELYGQEEYWTFPNKFWDCEDYVVLKRRILMKKWWPSSALLITVVRDENGDWHAVLVARTKQWDFVLDNKHSKIHIWHHTPYKFLMRQSYLDPMLWMALDKRVKFPQNK